MWLRDHRSQRPSNEHAPVFDHDGPGCQRDDDIPGRRGFVVRPDRLRGRRLAGSIEIVYYGTAPPAFPAPAEFSPPFIQVAGTHAEPSTAEACLGPTQRTVYERAWAL